MITNLAYPLGDLLLIALVVSVIGLSGWRLGRSLALLAAGLLLFATSDCLYLFQTATGTYDAGTMTDFGWLAGCVILAWAAWQREGPAVVPASEGSVLFLAPVIVILSFFVAPVPLTLIFDPLLLGTLVVTVLLVETIVIDGEGNAFEGAMLLGLYAIIGAAVWFGPQIAT